MLTRLILTSAVLAVLAPTAAADKFWFTTKEQDEKMHEDSKPSHVEGVLLSDEAGVYRIRVEGGEIGVAADMVVRVERDGLTVAQIEDREKAAAERLAEADRVRQEWQAAEAAAEQARAEAREAAARQREEAGTDELTVVVDFQGLLPNYKFKVYDPVLHRANLIDLAQVIEGYLRGAVLDAAHR